MSSVPIDYPARFAPGFAVNFADDNGAAVVVSRDRPLPVAIIDGDVSGSVPAPLAGSTSAALVAGPFAPALGRAVVLSLTGTWTGTVQVLRSVDGGATRLPLTIGGSAWARFTANVCEPVWEENEQGATLYLALSPAGGSISYRVAQ
jgi:hypothetical protein